MNPRVGRRALLLAGLGSVAAACDAGGDDVSGALSPLPAEPDGPVAGLKPVSYWAGVFLRSWDYQTRTALPMTRSADSWDHYNVSYTVDALVAMFRATGERRYLDRALQYTENVVAAARPRRGGYLGWVSARQDGDEVPLYESYFWRYGTALLLALRENPSAYADRGYRARYDRLLSFAEKHVFEKWFSRGPGETIYRERTHMTAHWGLIALNLARCTADNGRRARYTTVIADVDQHVPGYSGGLKQQMRRNPAEPTAYFWSDVWGSAQRPGQDVSHGNGVMAYVVEARDRGATWTKADMAAFSRLLTRVVWPGSTTYRAFVDGTGADNGWFSDGFVKLGRHDAAVQQRLESHQVVNDQFAANMALNARFQGEPR
ncbi:hypothetical protein [Paractinoplanes brasiliensis]|uniref:Glycosyl hydrolase family 76 n=1 Tax=Paractinoplanes brasiliensis TaxID=52695 RepID=A0A4R6JXZ7_9ACTN|nr:hypothetical protein [Actinoplanes brasiliensis]TDO41694.1 hypothetical protein C8E87_5432 [Actinoplanes brasiliensis]GID27017.1 hypothetical protein Abr02nite_20000 [Actinoplanes brasiliensis]